MKVEFTKRAEGRGFWYRLEAREHAQGSHEVCNASTAILMALIGYQENRDDVRKGYAVSPDEDCPETIVWCRTESKDEGIDAAWIMTAIALLQLEGFSPQSLKVTGYLDLWPEGDDEVKFTNINYLPADKVENL